jgi:hypothetical protein
MAPKLTARGIVTIIAATAAGIVSVILAFKTACPVP